MQNLKDIRPKPKLKKYEAMFLLDNREVKKGWDYAKGIPLSILERNGARIVSARRWDERKLAYEIKKQKRATFLLVFFEAPPEKISQLNREIQLTDGILRHLILVHDEFPPVAFEPVEDDVDVSKIPLGDEEEPEETEQESTPGEGEKEEGAGKEAPQASGEEGTEAEAEKEETSGAGPEEETSPEGENPAGGEEETKPQEG